MTFDFSAEIAESFTSKMAAIAAALGGDGLDEALLAAGWVIANDAKRRAPYITGTLRRSIRVEVREHGVVVVGSEVPYARRIEYGFIGKDSRGRNYHQAAQPYLRPAMDENKDEVRETIIAGVLDILRKASA